MGKESRYSFRRALKSASYNRARVPSLAYALCYLGAFPAFAVVYTGIPGHFYHETASYEHQSHVAENRLKNLLQNEIRATFRKEHQRAVVDFGEWSLDSNDIHVRSIDIDKTDVLVSMDAIVKRPAPEHDRFRIFSPVVRFPVSPSLYYRPDRSGEEFSINVVTFGTVAPNPINTLADARTNLPRILFPYDHGPETAPLVLLPLPLAITQDLRHLAGANYGFPHEIPGHFARMLYLSVVTITTLGYGDIVPVSTTARTLIAIEAVVGILLVGLFLNAIAHEGRRGNEVPNM